MENFLFSPIYAIIISNLFPLFMVLFFNWSLAEILPLYWAETGIIGFFNILKILISKKELEFTSDKDSEYRRTYHFKSFFAKLLISIFFIFHFGIFMTVHGFFVFGLILGEFMKIDFSFLEIMYSIKYAFLFMFASNFYSFFKDYVLSKEYLNVSPNVLLFAPYKRVIVMHITILLGAFLFLITNMTNSILFIFILIKIFFELRSYKKFNEVSYESFDSGR